MPRELERVCPRCEYRTTRSVASCPSCELPLREQDRTWTEQRRAVRVALPPGIQGELGPSVTVTVLDLSPLGARLAHLEPLLPEQSYVLTVALPEAAPLRLPGRVVWSRAQPFEPEPGRTGWIYHSGVEFRGVPASVARDLAVDLERVATGHDGSASGTVAPRAGSLQEDSPP